MHQNHWTMQFVIFFNAIFIYNSQPSSFSWLRIEKSDVFPENFLINSPIFSILSNLVSLSWFVQILHPIKPMFDYFLIGQVHCYWVLTNSSRLQTKGTMARKKKTSTEVESFSGKLFSLLASQKLIFFAYFSVLFIWPVIEPNDWFLFIN